MHTLVFLEPGHFHAALTLRERHPLVRDEIAVYAGAEPVTEFLGLVEAFNRRPERPTRWRVEVRAGDDPLGRLLRERPPGEVVVLAGRNDRKMALARGLHDAGFPVLADKPWITRAEALADVRHVLSGGAPTMEMMTSRHAPLARVAEWLVHTPEVFGTFEADGGPAIRLTSVHHLEKRVNGAPLRRPPWYFDVRVQGDGLADIPTHLVDQAQRLLAGVGAPDDRDAQLLTARRWATPVPRELFARVTGLSDFPADLAPVVGDGVLAYAGNAELAFRLRGVEVHLATRWDLTEPSGGGDAHATEARGSLARVRLEQGPGTGFRRRLVVEPRGAGAPVRAALERALAAGPPLPGLTLADAPDGLEVVAPALPGTAHEGQFPLVLDEFLSTLGRPGWPDARAADTLAKYELLARALATSAAEPGLDQSRGRLRGGPAAV